MLTLAVNVAVMTLALYAGARLHDVDRVRGVQGRRGTRPAWIRACSSAIFLIFVELMLVTAVALFFSTFSTPILSAALTFGIYVAGHFNTELRNFDQVVELQAGRLAGARRCITSCRTSPPSTSRRRSCTACRSAAGYVLWTAGYGLAYIAALLLAATVIFSRRDFK